MHPVTQLLILAVPIACITRTVVYEELFREFHDRCAERSQACRGLVPRKFFYLFTCEYCFSHYVTAAVLAVTRFHLLYDGWRGYFVAFFSLVFIANVYLSLYARLKVDLTHRKTETAVKKRELES